MTVNVKLPFIPSTSGWQPNVTWSNSSIPVAAALCRASLGTWLRDSAFAGYWKQWELSNTPRSAYHFMKNDYGSADQARFFVECVNAAGGIQPGDKLCLDVEEEYNLSISAMIDWFYNVQVLMGIELKDLLLYTRSNIVNPLSFAKLSQAERDYLLEIPTWIAGYPDDPNPYGFEQLKGFYQADPLRFGKCILIQYAASIEIPGINPIEGRSTECNVADPDYLTQWQAKTGMPPTGDPKMQVTAKYNLNIRTGPATSYSQVTIAPTQLLAGQIADVISLNGTAGSEQWAEIGASRWVNVWHAGFQNAILSGELPPPTGETKPSSMDLTLHYDDGTSQTVNGITLPNAS